MKTRHKKYDLRRIRTLVFGCLTGAICGGVLALFLTCARVVLSYTFGLYAAADTPLAVVCLLTLVLLCCFAAAVLQTLFPIGKGSGIPLAECCARGMLRTNPFSAAAALVGGSLLSFLCGMSVGSEGPSVGVGGLIGDGVGRAAKTSDELRRHLITGGASSGLAVAFNAPLTGITFALEETHRRFSPDILLAACSSVVSAVLVSQAIFYGFGRIEYLNGLGIRAGFTVLPYLAQTRAANVTEFFKLCAIALLCGATCGGIALAFNRAIFALSDVFKRVNNALLRLLPTFVLTAVIALSLKLSVGSGEAMLEAISQNTAFWLLFALFAARLITTVCASGAGVTGGLFLPMIAIGGLLGAIAAKICVMCGLPEAYAPNITMLCIAAFFAASVRAPISAVALTLELTASFANLLPCAIAVAAAMILADFTRTAPLYERMMEDLQRSAGTFGGVNPTLHGVVTDRSAADGKRIRDILWPYNSLVIGLDRDGTDIVPDGETVLRAGDRLTVRADRVDEAKFREQMREYIEVQVEPSDTTGDNGRPS
ncbi:MAG: chloride channel protein [Roseburia sp.]|nr:chloride channel protein [Roseburia sp.]